MKLLYTPSFTMWNTQEPACWVYALEPSPTFFGMVIKRENVYFARVLGGSPMFTTFKTRGQAAQALFLAWRLKEFRRAAFFKVGVDPELQKEIDRLSSFLSNQLKEFREAAE